MGRSSRQIPPTRVEAANCFRSVTGASMADKDDKQPPPPPPPPSPVLNRFVLALVGILLVMSPLALLPGSRKLGDLLAGVLSGESLTAFLPALQSSPQDTPPAGPEEPTPEYVIPTTDFAEVFRFDMRPDYLVQRWPRVTAATAGIQLQGYRVPLLTGTREDDLAGAVTYYFNPRQEVQRITFRGTTGNANRLIQYLAAQFGFCHRPTNDPGLFLYVVPEEGSRGGVKSYLWIRPQRVLRAAEPHARFELDLVIERPTEELMTRLREAFPEPVAPQVPAAVPLAYPQ